MPGVARGLVVTLVLLLVALQSSAQQRIKMASIFSKDPLRSSTSSTLGWVSSTDGEQPPLGAVNIYNGEDVWCRSDKHGQWAAGAVRDGVCHFPFLNSVYSSRTYDTLVSINGSARLKHVHWDKFSNFPSTGVTTPQMVLAVLEDENTGHFKPGFVDHEEREPYFLNGDQVERSVKATLITEDEPKEYELLNIVFTPKSMRRFLTDILMSDIYLENTSTEEMLVSSDEEYSVKHEQYWGTVKGTVTGAKFSTPDKSDMYWGSYNDDGKEQTQRVEYLLPAGAAVRGKLIAKIRKLETGYTATLTAIYEDGFQKNRPISALHKDERMAELRVDFEQPFNLTDGIHIDEYNVTSHVLRHSTTTTTTTTTTTAAPPLDEDDKPRRSPHVVEGSANTYLGSLFGVVLATLAVLLHASSH